MSRTHETCHVHIRLTCVRDRARGKEGERGKEGGQEMGEERGEEAGVHDYVFV